MCLACSGLAERRIQMKVKSLISSALEILPDREHTDRCAVRKMRGLWRRWRQVRTPRGARSEPIGRVFLEPTRGTRKGSPPLINRSTCRWLALFRTDPSLVFLRVWSGSRQLARVSPLAQVCCWLSLTRTLSYQRYLSRQAENAKAADSEDSIAQLVIQERSYASKDPFNAVAPRSQHFTITCQITIFPHPGSSTALELSWILAQYILHL